MNERVRIIGVHPVPGHENVHLVAMEILDPPFQFDFCDLTQSQPGQPRENWQLPYGELCLEATPQKELYAFFFHDLDTGRPLETPFGELPLAPVTPLPRELALIPYQAP